MSRPVPESSLLVPVGEGGEGFKAVHLLVVGLAGSGKSTFISKATGDTSIKTGAGILGVTQDVEEYVLYHQGVEVHLIDTPGFGDSGLTDHEVLDKISTWINTVHSQGWKIGGIVYLFDVTRGRLMAEGEQSVRILEEMTGKAQWNHISLVTNKWHWTGSHANELQCEEELQSHAKAWKALREGNRPARTWRFLNTHESALEIIQWHLDQSFVPSITNQMADPKGPHLSLGDTNDGQVIIHSYTPKLRRSGKSSDLQRMDQIMSHKFNDEQVRFAIEGMLARLSQAKREQRIQQIGRWAIRLSMAGGTILVTLLTENPAALGSSVAAASRVEDRLQRQRAMKREEIASIQNAISSMFLQRK